MLKPHTAREVRSTPLLFATIVPNGSILTSKPIIVIITTKNFVEFSPLNPELTQQLQQQQQKQKIIVLKEEVWATHHQVLEHQETTTLLVE